MIGYFEPKGDAQGPPYSTESNRGMGTRWGGGDVGREGRRGVVGWFCLRFASGGM